jgi:hypothetical protein
MKFSTPVRLLKKKELVMQDFEGESKTKSFWQASQEFERKEKYMGREQLMQDLPSK